NGGSSYLDVSEAVGSDYLFITVGAFEASPANFGLVNELVTVEADSTRAIARMHAFDSDGRSLGVLDSFEMKPRATSLAPRTGSGALRILLRSRRLVARLEGSRTERVHLRIVDLHGRDIHLGASGTGETGLDLGALPGGCWIAQASSPSGRLERSFCLP
ncbi:MAG TPA: hypothetical protein PKY05_16195, partial [Fibrobacteria bacterium]|nr:hypothetical protein [Fibrobacteria bacterium]